MKYPAKVHVFGHDIDVVIHDKPLEQQVQDPEHSDRLVVYKLMAQYDPNIAQIAVVHNPDKPSVGESNFFHEVIEAIDLHGDLQMNHTQISTLSSALYQVWKDMPQSEAA